MESGALGLDTSAPSDPVRVPSDCSVAGLRRRAWARSRDSTWQETQADHRGPQEPQQRDPAGDAPRPSEEPGHVPNNITSWLIECRTPLGASLDDQSASPNRGALKNGCSFEDDLSLGAEADHLQSSQKKTGSCFGLAVDQKRSQFKERGRSMNSTGSGKSSTVSSVSELLDLYEEDPEEILLNLGFGRDEPNLSSKIPSRFFNGSSSARGIDIKVYLGAQLQRMEVENPNYALTSRFRQIEVLTSVANEFFQLYSQVSGQPVQRISSGEQGGEEVEGNKEELPLPLKRSSSALNAAKLLKKTITRHNLLMAAPEAPAVTATHAQNGHADHALANGQTHPGPDQDEGGPDANQKHIRKKDSCSLATVTEETNGDAETDRLMDDSSKLSSGPVSNGKHPAEFRDLQSINQRPDDQVIREKEEKNLTSTPEKPPPTLAPPQLAQLRIENADSFDMEEIQSNEDETSLPRTSRNTDLLRTVSQQSDSSGFAEEPSVDSGYLKVQVSSDSCDSETTVTSHPSQDVATPLALDHPAFNLPEGREEEAEPGGATEADGSSSSKKEEVHDGSSEQAPHYFAHQLPRGPPEGAHQDETQDVGRGEGEQPPEPEHTPIQSASEPEPEKTLILSTPKLEPEPTQILSASEPGSEHSQKQVESAAEPESPTDGAGSEDEAQVPLVGSFSPPAPSSQVLNALYRAKQNQLIRSGNCVDPKPNVMHPTPRRGRGRGGISLQRSSSLPSSLLSPSTVVSSVRIQFGRGEASFSQPRYSFKYTHEAGEDEEEEGEEDEEGQTNCLSTLIINPAASSSSSLGSNNQPKMPPTESPGPPKPIPRYLKRSSQSLHSSSPPPDWSGGHGLSWSAQSVPDLFSNQQQLDQIHQGLISNQNQQSSNPGQRVFPSPNPAAPYLYTNPGPNPNPGPYPFGLNPPPQYPTPLHPYASLPNLLHNNNPSLAHHSSLTSLHQPAASMLPQHGSLFNLHEPSTSTAPHHASLGNLHTGTPIMHHQGYSHPYVHQSPYHYTPPSSQSASPYLGYHGYNMNPHLAFPHPQFHPEHNHPRSPAPPAPGFLRGVGAGHGHGMSSTEMQLRRVLHDIKGTVQSLGQNGADPLDVFTEHRAAPPGQQSLADFQQKRRSLNMFRSQMMDLELSIIRQQALVYKHLSPADRLEVEQLQSLRSSVREELQELEQQLEDRLMELTQHTPHRGLHRDNSIDSLSTASALRAMEPVSDLLREQLFLQSELSYEDQATSTEPSTRSSSPVQGGGGVYRASINITPAPPPRPNTHTEEEEDEGGRVGEEVPEEETGAGEVRVENLQELIREIRESVAQEVRREIYNELMAAVSPRRSPRPAKQHPL